MPKKTKKAPRASSITDVSAKDVDPAEPMNILSAEDEKDCFDDDPITPEEEADLLISMEEFKSGKFTVIPRSCTDEGFFKILRGEKVI